MFKTHIANLLFLSFVLILTTNTAMAVDSRVNKKRVEVDKRDEPVKRVVNGVTLVGDVTKEDIKIAEGYKWIAKAFGHPEIKLIGKPNETTLNVEYHIPGIKNPKVWPQLVTLSYTKAPLRLSERNDLFNGQVNALLLFIEELAKYGHTAEMLSIKLYETDNRVAIEPPASMILMNYFLGDEEIIGFMMPYARNLITVQLHKRQQRVRDDEKNLMIKIFKHMSSQSEAEDIKLFEKEKKAITKQEDQHKDLIKLEEPNTKQKENTEIEEKVKKEE